LCFWSSHRPLMKTENQSYVKDVTQTVNQGSKQRSTDFLWKVFEVLSSIKIIQYSYFAAAIGCLAFLRCTYFSLRYTIFSRFPSSQSLMMLRAVSFGTRLRGATLGGLSAVQSSHMVLPRVNNASLASGPFSYRLDSRSSRYIPFVKPPARSMKKIAPSERHMTLLHFKSSW
jgi:hypothetical protein